MRLSVESLRRRRKQHLARPLSRGRASTLRGRCSSRCGHVCIRRQRVRARNEARVLVVTAVAITAAAVVVVRVRLLMVAVRVVRDVRVVRHVVRVVVLRRRSVVLLVVVRGACVRGHMPV